MCRTHVLEGLLHGAMNTPIAVALAVWLVLVIVCALHLWRSSQSIGFKIFYTLLLAVPFIGVVFYLWLSVWPARLPSDLQGDRWHTQNLISRRDGGKSVLKAVSEYLDDYDLHQRKKREQKQRRRELLRRLSRKKTK